MDRVFKGKKITKKYVKSEMQEGKNVTLCKKKVGKVKKIKGFGV